MENSSETSIGAASLRAVHQIIDPGPKIFDDPVIVQLLGADIIAHLKNREGEFFDVRTMALRSHIVLRSRYTEDCLKEAFNRGVRQYMILGAGLDTFGYRRPDWAHEIKIIEADHPASQARKIELLNNANITAPSNVSYTTIDFEKDDLSTLLNVIDKNQPVFLSLLGVMVYLSEHAVDKIFAFIASLAKGSEFVFTYSQKESESQMKFFAERAAAAGEPWIRWFTPETLVNKLQEHGLSSISFLDPATAQKLYYSQDGTVLPAPRRGSLVRVQI
ncbi:class I SAM-dependent methyltransferase [Chitinophagaceae bacterium LWZ2-11]